MIDKGGISTILRFVHTIVREEILRFARGSGGIGAPIRYEDIRGGEEGAGPHPLDPDAGPHTGKLSEDDVVFDDSAGHDHQGAGNTGNKVGHPDLLGVTADQHHIEVHGPEHEDGGAQEISVAGLLGVLGTKQDADKLQGCAIDNAAPDDNDVLKWDQAVEQWRPEVETGGAATIEIQEDDAKVADASIVNFEGGGGKVTDEGGSKVTVDITGSGGAADGIIVLTARGGAPRIDSGCAEASNEEIGSVNHIDMYILAFDKDVDEYAQWSEIVMPTDWDGGTITVQFVWTCGAGVGAGGETVCFAFKGRSWGDDEAIDQALGAAQAVTDTWLADKDVHIAAESAAITLAGTPAGGELVTFEVMRDVSEDDLDGDAWLIAVLLRYTRS